MVFNGISRLKRKLPKFGKKITNPRHLDHFAKKAYRGVKIADRIIQDGGDVAKMIAPEFSAPIDKAQDVSSRVKDLAKAGKRVIHQGRKAYDSKGKREDLIRFADDVNDLREKVKKRKTIERQTFQ